MLCLKTGEKIKAILEVNSKFFAAGADAYREDPGEAGGCGNGKAAASSGKAIASEQVGLLHPKYCRKAASKMTSELASPPARLVC